MINGYKQKMFDMEESYDFGDDGFFAYDENDEEESEVGMSALELFRYCVYPTVISSYNNLLILFAACILLRCTRDILRLPEVLIHAISALSGLGIIWLYSRAALVQSLIFGIGCYCLLLCNQKWAHDSFKGWCVAIPLAAVLVGREIWTDQEQWISMRGTQMLIAMRVISLAFDGGDLKFLEFSGYIFCVGTVMFGPWIPYKEYKQGEGGGGFKGTLISLSLSLLFFCLSNCLVEWVIPSTSNPLVLVYREALLFRTSHYFISYVAQASLGLIGLGNGSPITRPTSIEFPHSLVEVVVNWNLPMHRWLKTYIFRPVFKRFGAAPALLSAYLTSSLLHGLDPRLAAVLLTLAFLTHSEHSLRTTLASSLSSCIGPRPCPSPICPRHPYSSSHLLVHSANLLFSLVALFHLSYLGVLVDPTKSPPLSEAFTPWSELYFISHWICLTTYIIAFFL